jgi:hypothetical protein
MKSTLSLLAITAVFGAFLAAPLAARTGATDGTERVAPSANLTAADLLFADNDSDDDEDDDDDEGGDDDEGDEDDNRANGDGCADDQDQGDDDQPCNADKNKAPQGQKTPPKNGLFGNGAVPKAQVN